MRICKYLNIAYYSLNVLVSKSKFVLTDNDFIIIITLFWKKSGKKLFQFYWKFDIINIIINVSVTTCIFFGIFSCWDVIWILVVLLMNIFGPIAEGELLSTFERRKGTLKLFTILVLYEWMFLFSKTILFLNAKTKNNS